MEQTVAPEAQSMRSNEYSDRGSTTVTVAATDISKTESNGGNGGGGVNCLTTPVYGTRKSSRRLLQQLQQSSNENASCENSSHPNATGHSNNDKQDALQDTIADNSAGNSAVSLSWTSLPNAMNNTGNGINSVGTCTNSSNQHSTSTTVSSATSSTSTTIATTKHQRKWEMWQADDSRWFFEALNEHGKDFNAIHHYMIHCKSKKKTESKEPAKNKEQIRCYFNRQWNKISTLLDLNKEDVDKTALQLYALINYGEVWKKFNFKNDLKFDSKFKTHLHDMVFKGYTFMKVGKGKNFKLKTPTCKALKRLHNLDESSLEAQHLPKDVVIDLIPASNYAWLRVQSVANNPTLTVKCAPQKRLTSLIAFLEQRWNDDARRSYVCSLYTGKSMDESSTMVNNQSNSSPDKESSENHLPEKSQTLENRPKLRLRPHSTLTKNMTSIRLVRVPNPQAHLQTNFSLNAYKSHASSHQPAHCYENKKKRNLNHQTSGSNCSKKASREDSGQKGLDDKSFNNDKKSDDLQSSREKRDDVLPNNNLFSDNAEKSNPIIETVRSLNVLNEIVSLSGEQSCQSKIDALNSKNLATHREPKASCLSNAVEVPPNVTNMGEWLSTKFGKEATDKDKTGNEEINTEELAKPKELESSCKTDSPKLTKCASSNNNLDEMYRTLNPDIIRTGWTLNNTEELTIGELCFIFKSKGKLILQYDWDCSTQISSPKNVLNRLITAASIALQQLNKEKDETSSVNISPIKNCRNFSSTTNNRKNKRLRSLEFDNNSPDDPTTLPASLSTDKESSDFGLNDSRSVDTFAVPAPPTSRQLAKNQSKNRFVDEALLQEAKGQLNGRFPTRRLIRKPGIMKPQQFHLSLNTNQILGNDLKRLLEKQGSDNQALLSVITEAAFGNNSQATNPFITAAPTVVRRTTSDRPPDSQAKSNLNAELQSPNNLLNETANVTPNETLPAIENQRTSNFGIQGPSFEVFGSESSSIGNTNSVTGTSDQNFVSNELPTFSPGLLEETDNLSSIPLAQNSLENNDSPSKISSPASLSCLLDLSLSDTNALFNDSTDKYFFNSLWNGTGSRNTSLSTPTKAQLEQQQQESDLNSFPLSFNKLSEQFEQISSNFSSNSTASVVSSTVASTSCQNANLTSSNCPNTSSAWLHGINSELSLNNLFDCAMEQSAVEKGSFSLSKSDSDFAVSEQANHLIELPHTETMSIPGLMNESSVDLISKYMDFNE